MQKQLRILQIVRSAFIEVIEKHLHQSAPEKRVEILQFLFIRIPNEADKELQKAVVSTVQSLAAEMLASVGARRELAIGTSSSLEMLLVKILEAVLISKHLRLPAGTSVPDLRNVLAACFKQRVTNLTLFISKDQQGAAKVLTDAVPSHTGGEKALAKYLEHELANIDHLLRMMAQFNRDVQAH